MPATIHRFTPPTCTLEIIHKRSLFWQRKNAATAVKIQFQLRFDDPRQPTAKQVTIQGDQQKLLELKTIVKEYVQTQLTSSLSAAAQDRNIAPTNTVSEQLPRIKSQGLVHHELFFGSLSNDSPDSQIRLGTVQLLDLLTALEASETAIVAEQKQTPTSKQVIPLWGSIAAILIAAVSLIVFTRPQAQQQVRTSDRQTELPTRIPELEEIAPPKIPEGVQQSNTASPLKEPLASTKRLPPPPAVETPKPKPDIPDPADYPLETVARQSGLDNSANSLPTNISKPENDQVNELGKESAVVIPQQNESAAIISEEIPGESTLPAIRSQKQNQSEIAIVPEELALENRDLLESNAELDSELAIAKPVQQPRVIEEVTAYFASQWQPPADLKQGLEYRLFFDADGSIKRVIPLGKAAQFYLEQTNIPVNGEKLISTTPTSQPPTIRLLLDPDARVQVFIESEHNRSN
ncbi:MAG: DUF4335 domain-containing protein [Cyanobacteria bacterium P01_C01_bin.72]